MEAPGWIVGRVISTPRISQAQLECQKTLKEELDSAKATCIDFIMSGSVAFCRSQDQVAELQSSTSVGS